MKLFGTDGVRGIANKDLSPQLAYSLGEIGAQLLNQKGKAVIGRDTRISGDMLEEALSSGIMSSGVDVLELGVLPTPGIAYLTKALEADFGVVISASHNPAEYNGIKFFGPQGFKLSDQKEEEIEKFVLGEVPFKKAKRQSIGKARAACGATEYYINHLKDTVSEEFTGFTIAVDCANGSTYELAPEVIEELGATVLTFAADPDGNNINLECGSTYPKYVQEIVGSHQVNLGLAFDGDGDRVIAVDEKGGEVDGDFIMAICAWHLKKRGQLPHNSLVTTVMTNMGFDLAMKERGIEVVKTKVGDKYVLGEMRNQGITLGGEQSGHIIFLDYTTTGDGILTALQLMQVMRDTGKSLSELSKIMARLPQILINVEAKCKDELDEAKEVWQMVRSYEQELKGKGRILVRPSGTENLIRVMVESKSKDEASSIAQDIATAVQNSLN